MGFPPNRYRHGFLYSGGKYTTLDEPLATNGTFGRAINVNGDIVGLYIDSRGPQSTYTQVHGINDVGQIGT